MSYRNDGEGPRVGSGRSALGSTDTADVSAAVDYAIARGAQRVTLFGWSMGAAIALEIACIERHRTVIAGLVLDSPVLDWKAVVAANCVRAGLPACAGGLTWPWLRIALTQVAWITRAGDLLVPTLILHGSKDTSTPFEISDRLARLRPDIVRLEAFDSDHNTTWNCDPERWEAIASASPLVNDGAADRIR